MNIYSDSDQLGPRIPISIYSRSTEDFRWKWMTRSMAAVGVLGCIDSADAKTVQIDQTGNRLTGNAGKLSADLTGDGIDEWENFRSYNSSSTQVRAISTRYHNGCHVFGDGELVALARFRRVLIDTSVHSEYYRVDIYRGPKDQGSTPRTTRGLTPLTFSDARINGGQTTNGFAEILASSLSPTDNSIEILRLVFDDASTTAPEDVVVGGRKPEWIQAAEFAVLIAKNSKLKRKVKKFRKNREKKARTGNFSKARKLRKKVKKLKKDLRKSTLELDRYR